MSKIPFTLAEPGTDPTRQRNRIQSRPTWKDALPWVGGLVLFILLGKVLLGGGLGGLPGIGSKADTGAQTIESPTEPPMETPTAIPTATATATPTVSSLESLSEKQTTPETPEIEILGRGDVLITYQVGGVRCCCDSDNGKAWGADAELCSHNKPEACQ